MSDNKGRQIPLDLTRNAMEWKDFVEGSCNKVAAAWIRQWGNNVWPTNVMILHGPDKCGKTHLASVWQRLSGAAVVDRKMLAALNDENVRDLAASGKHLILEDIDDFIGDVEWEKGMFHLINLLNENAEEKRFMLITMKEAPILQPYAIDDHLGSRMRNAATAEIREPDESLIRMVLQKQFRDRQIRVGDDVIDEIMKYIERSFEGAHQAVDQINRVSMENSKTRAITPALVREVLLNRPQMPFPGDKPKRG